MSQTLNIRNFNSLNIIAQTSLNGDTAAGATSLTVQSNNDFIAGYVLLGAPGGPSAEMVAISATAGGTGLAVGVTKFAHNNADPVYMLFGNQLKIYSATDQYGTGQQPDDSHFSLVSGGTVNIDGGNKDTSFTDSNGTVGLWYKYTYYNAATPAETQLADSKAVQAGQLHYVSLDQIRSAAGFSSNKNITDDLISEFRDAAEREINGALLPVYTFPLPQPTNPIIVEIAKNIAAGELMHEQYINVSPQMAQEGEGKADAARHGGGSHTSLQELVEREVVLTDANYNEQTVSEGHGFGGFPDATTISLPASQGGDHGAPFSINEIY